MLKQVSACLILLNTGLISQTLQAQEPEQHVFKQTGTLKAGLSFQPESPGYGLSIQYFIHQTVGLVLNADYLYHHRLLEPPYSGYRKDGIKIHPEFRYYPGRRNPRKNTQVFFSTGPFYQSVTTHMGWWRRDTAHRYKYELTRLHHVEWGQFFKVGLEGFIGEKRRLAIEVSAGFAPSIARYSYTGTHMGDYYFGGYYRYDDPTPQLEGCAEFRIAFGYKFGPFK